MIQQLLPLRLSILSGLTLLMLVSCANQPTQPIESIAPQANPVEVANSTSTATGHLLSPEQVTRLTALPIPIVAPTYLPEGFRVVRADGEVGEYADGEVYAGYTIEYQGNDNTCFAIYSSSDGPDRLEQVGQVETALGIVNIHQDNDEGRSSLQSFISVEGNPLMISPLSHLTATGNFESCRALDRTEYERILRSIEWVH